MKRSIEITDQEVVHIIDGESGWKLDFNRVHEGFFPSCRLTSACCSETAFYIAGVDENDIPYLFSSMCGKVWTMETIEPANGIFCKEEYGALLFLLWDDRTSQLYAVSRRGYIIVVPDCQKCVRVRKVTDNEVISCRADKDTIYLSDNCGTEREYMIETMAQYRCAWSFAAPHVNRDGILIDLRDPQTRQEHPIFGAFYCEKGQIEDLLEHYPRDKYLFFICENGYMADDAARESRKYGIRRAYSLGSAYEFQNH